jgi:polyvinyl alcohol dehydrogenase (cytochrome)
VGTGENYSPPANDLSDAIVALDLADGRIRWRFQATPGDVFNVACSTRPPGPNCPAKRGPDFDFGASVVITEDANGKELLLAAQKSGVVWALDPDAEGKVVWQRQVGAGSALGGIHWGIAVADGRVYVPIADPQFPIPGYEPKPGLYALSVTDGAIVWSHHIKRGCETNLISYFTRTTLYPECSFYFGLSAAPTALPGAIVAGGLDGKLRIFAAADG